MALKGNWLSHLTAVLSADAFSHELAQDFWTESLFNPRTKIRNRWAKLLWVFSLSGFLHLTVITVALAIPITLYRNGGTDWTWSLIVIGAVAVFAQATAAVVASAVWLDLKRHEGSERPR